MGGLGRLAASRLPDGPVGPPSRWAATLNVEAGQTTYPVKRGGVMLERREWSCGQSHTEGRAKEGVEQGRGQAPLAEEGGLYLDICVGAPRVPGYATADGAGLLVLKPGPV